MLTETEVAQTDSLDGIPEDVSTDFDSAASNALSKLEKKAEATEPTPETTPEPSVDPVSEPETPKEEEKPAEEPTEKKQELPADFDPEIDSVKVPRGMPPHALKAISSARSTAREYKKKYAALEAEAAQLRQSAGSVPQELQQEVEELRKFRAIHAFEEDPVFKEKFDAQIEAGTNSIYEIIKGANILEDAALEDIKKSGGFFGAKVMDEGETEATPLLDSKWWKGIRENLPYSKQLELDHALKQTIALRNERAKELNNLGANRDKYYEEIKQKNVQSYQKSMQTFQQRTDALQKQFDWAKERPIPENASPEEKRVIQEDNEIFKKVYDLFPALLYPPDDEFRFDVALLAGQSFRLTKINERQTAQIESLTKQLQAIKTSGQTAKASSAAAAPKESKEDKSNLSLDEVADRFLKARRQNLWAKHGRIAKRLKRMLLR